MGGARSVGAEAASSGSPGSVNDAVRYRGLTAAQWAARFRDRTRQLQNVRRMVRARLSTNTYVERAFLCIHRYEGSWTDSGAPFWGGLQMDKGFQSYYGGWALRAFGTADKWPVSVQIATAIRAYKSGRGFRPWPNTARTCGLL